MVTETGTAYLLGLHTTEEPAVIGVAAQMRSQIKQGPRRTDISEGVLSRSSIAICSICQESCEAGQAWDVTPCKHAFHEECLRRWLTFCTKEAAENLKEMTPLPTCPDCRHPLSSSRFRLFG